jgi:hypothetical protein
MADVTDDLELLPEDDDPTAEPDDAVDLASATALDDDTDFPASDPDDSPDPLGFSFEFDFEQGRFVRRGGAPGRVYGIEALRQRCLMAVYSARFAHACFSDQFGIENPSEGIGDAGAEAELAAADWEVKLRDALLVLDHVAEVQVACEYDPVQGVIYVTDLVVTTEEEVELPFDPLALNLGG